MFRSFKHTQILRLGAELLSRSGYEWVSGAPRAVSVTIVSRDAAYSICVQGAAEEGRDTQESTIVPQPEDRPRTAPPGWKWFSPTSDAVIAALIKTKGWMSSEQLAQAAGVACTESFKGVLHDLVAREVLDSQPGRGYRLILPADWPA